MLSLINKRFIGAARNNQLDELKKLLSQGADIHADDDATLRTAAFNGHLEVVKFLITQGANIHANDDEPLRWAAKYGCLEIVKFLAINGANIHANNDEALKNSTLNEHYDVWKVLSAFIQEEKLLVAASVSTGASTWVCGVPVLPQKITSVDVSHLQRLSKTKTKRSKI